MDASLTSHQFDALQRNWSFHPSPVPRWRKRYTVEAWLWRSQWRPPHVCIRAPTDSSNRPWVVYFLYSPDASLSASQSFTLQRLRDDGLQILAVVATRDYQMVPHELRFLADAVYWKGLDGYDFSGYTVGLEALAALRKEFDVFVVNDSVFGPFRPLSSLLKGAQWQLSGLTASGLIENHIQSYAFVLPGFDARVLAALRPVLTRWRSLIQRDDVIAVQEARMARIAARRLSVGATWYCPDGDATQRNPLELLVDGHPFLKRSLLSARSSFVEKDLLRERLRTLGHPDVE